MHKTFLLIIVVILSISAASCGGTPTISLKSVTPRVLPAMSQLTIRPGAEVTSRYPDDRKWDTSRHRCKDTRALKA